jgi:hypothetical protein
VRDATTGVLPKPVARPAAGGATIQLGAYGSQSGAQDAWNKLTRRYTYLSALTMSVESVQVNGATLYRLRASGPDAGTLCGRLKVAGETCMTVS